MSAWQEFTETLANAEEILERGDVTLDELDRAEGRRFLGRLARLAFHALEVPPDPYAPQFRAFGPPDVTFGIPNPDNLYQSAPVDPACTYRITGRRNTVRFLGFGAQAPGIAATPGTASHLDDEQLARDADGTFEIVASATPGSGNWIELTPAARTIMVRQTFVDRAAELAAELAIECLDPPARSLRAEVDPGPIDDALTAAAHRVEMLSRFWVDWVAGFAQHAPVNEFFILDEATHLGLGGDPQVRTPLCRWYLAPGEALAVELRPPVCDYWNIQLANIWTEPLSAPGPTCTNYAHARGGDAFRFVLADRDPGDANWLDTGGHRNGLISVRWVRADALPLPATEVVLR